VRSAEGSEDLNKYRRIEVKAFRRRVSIVSGEWPRDIVDTSLAETNDGVLVNDIDLCPVEPESPEGQLILVDAIRSLERRLSPEARAMIRDSSGHPHVEPE
jgi:hypothetical protein